MTSEQWLELGQDYLFDELVELGKLGDNLSGNAGLVDRYLESRVEIHLFHLCHVIGRRGATDHIAVLKARGEQSSVLVDVVEVSDVQERFIPAIVRLQPFDDYLRRYGQAPYLHDPGWVKAIVTWSRILIDGPFRERAALWLRVEREHDVVEEAPQIVDEIAREYRRSVGRRSGRIHHPNVIAGLRVNLTNNAVTVEYGHPLGDFELHAAQMFLGPLAFQVDHYRNEQEVA